MIIDYKWLAWLVIFFAMGTALLMQGGRTRDLQPVMTVPDMIRYWGYDAEEFTIKSPDGYSLAMHRIPPKPGTPKRENPVFLGHCLVGSSAVYTFGPPHESLAYLLSDQGYDVWIPNMRGNQYSRVHEHLDPNDKEFWDFNLEDSAILDYPIAVDFILNQTASSQVYFVGYSMGTTQYLIFLSQLPEYNDKIKAGYLLAPTAFGGNASEPLITIAKQHEKILSVFDLFKVYEFMPNFLEVKTRLANAYCGTSTYYSEHCRKLFAFMLNVQPEILNIEMIPTYMSHLPAGSSTRQFVHFAQFFSNGGKFTRYDHGRSKNLELYGKSEPPEYDLTQVVTPTALFVGKNDLFSPVEDTAKLASLLPNLLNYDVLDDDAWTHMHFIWSRKAREKVYNKIILSMETEIF